MTTKITLGPLLGIESNNTYTFIILLQESSKIPKLFLKEKDAATEENSIEHSFKQTIGEKTKFTLYRFEYDSHRMDVHFLEYSFKIEDELLIDAHGRSTWQFKVISQNEIPNIAFVSCNGHHGQYPQPNNQEHYKGWQMMPEAKPDYLFLTGDQVYTDSLFNDIQELKGYLDGKKDMLDEAVLHDAIIKLYIDSWTNQYLSLALATIPNVMTWDDHDIIDGYGSHKDKYNNLLRPIFTIAKKYYELFQIRTIVNKTLLKPGFDYSMHLMIRNYDFIIPDTRSHRTISHVLNDEGYNLIENLLSKLTLINHKSYAICFILPVPLAHKDYFTWVERIANWIGDLFTFKRIFADDLLDHWDHVCHKDEQIRMLDLIFKFGQELKAKNVMVISGDVHASGAATITSHLDKKYEVTQIISSPIVNKSSGNKSKLLFFFSSENRKMNAYEACLLDFGTLKRKHIANRNFVLVKPHTHSQGGTSLNIHLFVEQGTKWTNRLIDIVKKAKDDVPIVRKVNNFIK